MAGSGRPGDGQPGDPELRIGKGEHEAPVEPVAPVVATDAVAVFIDGHQAIPENEAQADPGGVGRRHPGHGLLDLGAELGVPDG